MGNYAIIIVIVVMTIVIFVQEKRVVFVVKQTFAQGCPMGHPVVIIVIVILKHGLDPVFRKGTNILNCCISIININGYEICIL